MLVGAEDMEEMEGMGAFKGVWGVLNYSILKVF